VYAPAERADTLLLFLLYPYLYSVEEKGRLEGAVERRMYFLESCIVRKIALHGVIFYMSTFPLFSSVMVL
jgi:hypothetical protein